MVYVLHSGQDDSILSIIVLEGEEEIIVYAYVDIDDGNSE